jgi:hypothetical protein
MAIDELVALIPPPAKPIDNDGDWSVPERELGATFPTDFKQLIQRYGTGYFWGSLVVANPLSKQFRNPIQGLLKHCQKQRKMGILTCSLFPEKSGLLPWGTDDNGHLYCWLTTGRPVSWPVVQIFHGYESEIEPVPGPITSYLVKFVGNKYPKMLGGIRFTKKKHYFVQNF